MRIRKGCAFCDITDGNRNGGTDDKDSMGERLGILYVIRQKQYRLILPPVCDKMGKKRKRVEENAVRTNAGNAEKLLGHPENVY